MPSRFRLKSPLQLGLVAQVQDPTTWKTEVGEWKIQDLPRLQREFKVRISESLCEEDKDTQGELGAWMLGYPA